MRPHKFVSNNAPTTTGVVVFCEYCGLVVHNGNKSGGGDKAHTESIKGCPLNPVEPDNPEIAFLTSSNDGKSVGYFYIKERKFFSCGPACPHDKAACTGRENCPK